jgi:hypothetical protein
VEVSADGSSWTVVAEGKGNGFTTITTFQPVQARRVRMTLMTDAESDAPAWSIQNLRIYALPPTEKRTETRSPDRNPAER